VTIEEGALETAYLGLGSNLDDPERQVRRGLADLDSIPHTQCVMRSGLYQSPPMGPPDQPHYVNAVAMVHTRLSPEGLLDALLLIERAHGRVRGGEHWGPRTLDLDILLYGNRVVASPRLSIPHPGMASRAFVLFPLKEICADIEIPGAGHLDELIKSCRPQGLTRIGSA
jgi:2-amino-4-hydroxy-6-hydroxymethyldihydropteridine diphosphokinase